LTSSEEGAGGAVFLCSNPRKRELMDHLVDGEQKKIAAKLG
jgi:hypothetical protein